MPKTAPFFLAMLFYIAVSTPVAANASALVEADPSAPAETPAPDETETPAAVTVPTFAEIEETFWDSIKDGDYGAAAEISRTLGAQKPEYYCLTAICHRNALQYRRFDIYRLKYDRLADPAKVKELLLLRQVDAQDPRVDLVCGITAAVFPETGLGDPAVFLRAAAAGLPDDPYVHNYLALTAMNNADYGEQIEELAHKAITLKEDFPEPYNNLAVIMYQRGRIEDAVDALLLCLKNCPTAPDTTYDTLITLISREVTLTVRPYNGEEQLIAAPAIKHPYLDKVRSVLLSYPGHLLALAENYLTAGNPVTASALIREGDFRGYTNFYDYVMLRLHDLLGNFDQTILLADKLLAAGYQDYRRLLEMGNIFYFAGQTDKAIRCYEVGLGCIDSDDDAYLLRFNANIGSCHYTAGNYQEALTHLNAALSYDATDWLTLENLGLTHRALGNKDQARTYLEQALDYVEDEEEWSRIRDYLEELAADAA